MFIWQVDNIKCGGCAKRIVQKLQSLAQVDQVRVDVALGQVSFEASGGQQEQVADMLTSLGYPRSGTTSGLSSVSADVRSVVSCAIGRLQSDVASS
jgi:copper chaperone